MTVEIEIDEVSENNPLMKKRIRCWFPYSSEAVLKAHQISGCKFDGATKQPFPNSWTFPLDVDTCHLLRKQYGSDLKIGPKLAKWYKVEYREVSLLTKLAEAEDAELKVLPVVLPDLYEFIAARPYQKADIAFMAYNQNPANFSQPGLGKTVETIASVFESKMDDGPQLVVAPVSSLSVVWQYELERWQPYPVLVARQDPGQRLELMMEAQEMYEEGDAFWLLINPAMVRYRRVTVGDSRLLVPTYPELFDIQWKHKIIDEFHKAGLGNTETLTHQAMVDLKADKAIGISGTPMGGKAIKMYGVLHYLNPKEFSSKWQFANRWLSVTDSVGRDGQVYGKKIEDVREDRYEEFTKMLARHAVRRTKEEVVPELPPKMQIRIWAELEGEQLRQYKEFERRAAVVISEDEVSATSILAEFVRLKQFADASQVVTFKKIKRRATGEVEEVLNLKPVMGDSCKLSHVERILNELGIDPTEMAGEEQVVICSQFSSVVDMVHGWLLSHDYPAAKFTGATSADDRTLLVRQFQDPEHPLRILVMTTTAGGVSITLDNANTMIVLDETWVPDDQEQVADRLHRASRIHQVTIYTISTKDSIEEYIRDTNIDKQNINDMALAIRKRLTGK